MGEAGADLELRAEGEAEAGEGARVDREAKAEVAIEAGAKARSNIAYGAKVDLGDQSHKVVAVTKNMEKTRRESRAPATVMPMEAMT